MNDEKLNLTARCVFTPASQEGFTQTAAHYTATVTLQSDPAWHSGSGKGHDEYQAVRNAVEAFLDAAGRSNTAFEITETKREGYPPAVLEKLEREEREKAARAAKAAAEDARWERLQSLAEQKLGGRGGWILERYRTKPALVVSAHQRFNTYRHRSETVEPGRRFPLGANGEPNWAKALEAVTKLRALKAQERRWEDEKRTGEQQATALLAAIKSAYPLAPNSPFQPRAAGGQVTLTITLKDVEQAGRVLAALQAAGVVPEAAE